VIAEITGIVGIISTLSALWITVSDRRHRAAERREEAESAAALKLAASQVKALEAEFWQVRQIKFTLEEPASPKRRNAEPGPWQVLVVNRSNLPVTDVRVLRGDEEVGAAVDVQAGAESRVVVSKAREQVRLADFSVQLRDARRQDWRCNLAGGIAKGEVGEDGYTLTWGPARLIWGEPAGADYTQLPEGGEMHILLPSMARPARRLVASRAVGLAMLWLVAAGCFSYLLFR
jgi:hypothetical protein